MCGLAGLARSPHSTLTNEQAVQLFSSLLRHMAARGRHATGFAAQGGKAPNTLVKLAIPAPQFVTSAAYKTALGSAVDAGATILLGHTRHATHANATVDAAAHPFQFGSVVGAHNGIITNWQDIMADVKPADPWINDSQAPFALLAATKNPNTALDRLTGYWALSWIKKRRVYLCRTSSAQLSVAYVPDHRLLVWASTRHALQDSLASLRLMTPQVAIKEIPHGQLLEFDPDLFSAGTPNEATTPLTFAANARNRKAFDTSLTDERAVQGEQGEQLGLSVTTHAGPGRIPLTDAEWQQGDGFKRYVGPGAGKAVEGRGRGGKRFPVADPLSPADHFAAMWRALDTLRTKDREREADLAHLRRRVADLEAQVEPLQAELKHLYSVVNQYDLIDRAAV